VCAYHGYAMSNLKVQIVNGEPEDVADLIAYLRERGHEATENEVVELRDSQGIGDVILMFVQGVAAAATAAYQVRTWIRERYADKAKKPSGPTLWGSDAKPLVFGVAWLTKEGRLLAFTANAPSLEGAEREARSGLQHTYPSAAQAAIYVGRTYEEGEVLRVLVDRNARVQMRLRG